MSGTLIVISAAFFLVLALGCWRALFGGSNRGSRRKHQEADRLIGEAEVKMMSRQTDSAADLYNRAAKLAVGAPILMSEAHYGLFRVCKHRRDRVGAVRQINLAISFSPKWREFKPDFESLLQREKALVSKSKS